MHRTYDPFKGLNDEAALESEVFFICVPTPFYLGEGGFDDSFIRDAIKLIKGKDKIIVLKSTIIPGTTEKFQTEFRQHDILFNPEFLTESTADRDMEFPNRQIVGYASKSRKSAELVMGILPTSSFQKIIPANEAEMLKYIGNAFYSLKVSFANQMYDLCSALGIDYSSIKDFLVVEPWLGNMYWEIFHKGYRGYGGKCLPKDTRAIIDLAKSCQVELTVLESAEQYNNKVCQSQGIDLTWKEGSPDKKEFR